ncbi:MAG: phosphopentomutase, partial [Spirochaetia bacterium]|nr:phosphopentomutase [Spirochaetia bacterium]
MDAVLIVIDSFGIGALPDAPLYGDEGANTALHICESIPGPKWPFLRQLGLGNASEILGNTLPGCPAVASPIGGYCVMAEKSPGKDTTTGHWEIAGIILDKPFTTFPPDYPSFPKKLTEAFVREAAPGYLGNYAASGTEIIKKLGEKHIETGFPIIYTSSDSVLQIAAHEDIIPVEKLYEMCRKARKICDCFQVGRVIARPFTGSAKEGFTRSEGRHDFSIKLPEKTVLDHLQEKGVKTIGVGKIGDIFNRQGLSESFAVKGNEACLEKTFSLLSETSERDNLAGNRGKDRFIFVNLVDTD